MNKERTMYQSLLIALSKNFGGNYTFKHKINVWLHKIGSKTLMTSDKGHRFNVDNKLCFNDNSNHGFEPLDSLSAWLYHTGDQALLFVTGYGVYLINDVNEKARFIPLDHDLAIFA